MGSNPTQRQKGFRSNSNATGGSRYYDLRKTTSTSVITMIMIIQIFIMTKFHYYYKINVANERYYYLKSGLVWILNGQMVWVSNGA